MKAEVKKRLTWIRLYEEYQDAGFVCRKCCISRPTLRKWWNRYNWERPHSSLGGKTPMDKYFPLSAKTPFSDEAYESYDENNEPLQNQNYRLELKLRKLK